MTPSARGQQQPRQRGRRRVVAGAGANGGLAAVAVTSVGRDGLAGSVASGYEGLAALRAGGPHSSAIMEVQRARVLSSAAAVIAEHGYQRMSVARVTGRARVSRRTFYDLFVDREDCFLAVLEDALARVTAVVVDAYEGASGGWRERVRAGLAALLWFFEQEPECTSLLVVDALGAGPRVLARRAEVLAGVGLALDGAVRGAKDPGAAASPSLSGLTGEGVVGAVFSVVHTRLSRSRRGGSMVEELLSPLMAVIVLPYLGLAAARKEQRGTRVLSSGGRALTGRSVDVVRSAVERRSPARAADVPLGDPLAGLSMRVTYRTLRVLGAIGERPGASNRVVADLAGVADQGQISKLLARLERLGLIENATTVRHDQDHRNRRGGHQPSGEPNEWGLTPRGQEVVRAAGVAASVHDGSSGDGHRRKAT